MFEELSEVCLAQLVVEHFALTQCSHVHLYSVGSDVSCQLEFAYLLSF